MIKVFGNIVQSWNLLGYTIKLICFLAPMIGKGSKICYFNSLFISVLFFFWGKVRFQSDHPVPVPTSFEFFLYTFYFLGF